MTKLLPLTIGEKTQYYILHRVYIFDALVDFDHEVYYTETLLSGACLKYKLAFKVQQNYSSSFHWTFIALTTFARDRSPNVDKIYIMRGHIHHGA